MTKTIISFALLSANIMNAQLLLNDNLNGLTPATLSGQGSWTNNSSTYGGGACAGAICTDTQVGVISQSYPNYDSAINSAKAVANQDAVGRNFTPMSLPADGNTFYFSFLVNASSVPTGTPAEFIRILSNGSFNTAIRIAFQNATGGFKVGGSKNGTNTFSSTILPLNTTHLIVIKYTHNSGNTNDDVISIYLNPTSTGEPVTANHTISSGNDYAATLNLDRFFIRTSATLIPTANLTSFKAAKTYADLFTSTLSTSESVQSNDPIKILENPVNNLLKISLSDKYNTKNTMVSVFDLSGRKMLHEKYSENINISNLKKGIYVVDILNEKKKFSFKIIKN